MDIFGQACKREIRGDTEAAKEKKKAAPRGSEQERARGSERAREKLNYDKVQLGISFTAFFIACLRRDLDHLHRLRGNLRLLLRARALRLLLLRARVPHSAG